MEEICKNWSNWLKKTRFSYMDEKQIQQTLAWLGLIRDKVINLAQIKENYKVADFGCCSGLLGFGVLDKFQDKIELIFSDKFEDCLETCQEILKKKMNNVKFLQSDITNIKLQSNYLDVAMTRSVLVHVLDKKKAFQELYRVLKHDGKYCAFEPIISENTRYYELLNQNEISNYEEFKKAEREFMENQNDPLVNFSADSLDKDMIEAGFSDVIVNVDIVSSKYIANSEMIKTWFQAPPAPNQKTMKERFLEYFEEKKVDNFINEVMNCLDNKEIQINTKTALIKAVK